MPGMQMFPRPLRGTRASRVARWAVGLLLLCAAAGAALLLAAR